MTDTADTADTAESTRADGGSDAVDTTPVCALTAPDAAIERARFDSNGLLPAVIQEYDTGEVLMLGWMDREAMRRTLAEGRVTFWSRSREQYWRKGDTSGHVQYVHAAALDCDADTLLVRVTQIGAACHTGTRTCFDGDPIAVAVDPDTDRES